MNKCLLAMVMFLIIPVISANLIISPMPLDIQIKVGEQITRQVTLENKYDFPILDFKFGNLSNRGFTFPEIEIPKNSSKTFDVTISATESIHENIQVPISFRFYVDLPDTATTHHVNVSMTGFSPNYLIIREGDTIVWHNNDDVSHQVFSSLFDYPVQVNGTAQHTFASAGEIDYYDPVWYDWGNFEGTIETINRTSQELAHNPNYDLNWVVNLDSILNPTNLSVGNSKSSYEIEYGKFKNGLLTIKNNGTEIADIVKLTSDSDWIAFNKNDLTILPGEEDWVEYTMTPILFSTNQTDKVHTINIKIKASNSDETIIPINIFVPFKEITSELGGSDVDTLNWIMNVFCPSFPTSFLCNQSIMQGGNGTGQFADQQIPINVSAEALYAMKKDISKMKDSQGRTDNQLKLIADKWGLTIPQMMDMVNRSVILQEENEKKDRTKWNSIWIIGFGIFLIIATIYTINLFSRRKYKQDLLGGVYKYRR